MKNKPLKKYLILFLFAGFQCVNAIAQKTKPEEISKEINKLKRDKNHQSNVEYLKLHNQLAFYYAENLPDSALQMLVNQPELCKQIKYYEGEADAIKIRGTAYKMKGNFVKALECFESAIEIAKQHNYKDAIPGIQSNIGLVFMNQGDYTKSLQSFYDALKSAEGLENKMVAGRIWNNIGTVHFFQGNLEKSMTDYQKMLEISIETQNHQGIILAHNNIGEIYLEKNDLKAALISFNKAIELLSKHKNDALQIATTKNLGLVYFKMNEIEKSVSFFNQALKFALLSGNKPSACKALIGMAKAYNQNKNYAVALQKSEEATSLAKEMNHRQLLRDAYEIKAIIYENQGDGLLALKSYKFFKLYSDSLKNIESEKASDLLKTNYDFSKKELDYQKKEIRQRWVIFTFVAALISMLIIAYIINRNRYKIKKSNEVLKEKNQHIEEQNVILEQTLSQLKSTQTKLIQSEKLASLGELTAGIAHEIQNPLNFVNNFSELSVELIEELKSPLTPDGGILVGEKIDMELLADITQNLEKINLHGKRASSIVKGMLEHSRASTGVKELTDINKLADEYLRLSYHGLRAKDSSFNSDFKTDFDENLPKIEVKSQDLGRVLLNLFNNAFYAVNISNVGRVQNSAKVNPPQVIVSTHQSDNQIVIKVKDNGTGMSEATKVKIFQPFFTTKPTGQGTGLGLSLSYDIITKGHGGTLEVESMEGEGTEFIIKLPMI
jgi:two-component system NtrC family sensor kinase